MIGLRMLRKMSEAIDRRYLKKVGAMAVPQSKSGLLLICFHAYEGKKTIQIPDNVTIKPGDLVGELHLSNIRITEIASKDTKRSLEWHLIETLRSEFHLLAGACQSGEISRDVQAFYGVNVMGPATKRLGFTLIPIPKGLNRIWLGFWESFLRKIYYSYKTSKKVTLKKTLNDAFEIWISKGEIIRRYAQPKNPR